jgi:hypothetical protein
MFIDIKINSAGLAFQAYAAKIIYRGKKKRIN